MVYLVKLLHIPNFSDSNQPSNGGMKYLNQTDHDSVTGHV